MENHQESSINMDYLLSAEDMRLFTLLNPPKSKNARWSNQTLAFSNDGRNKTGHQDLKKEIEQLPNGQQLLIPVNLTNDKHWVAAVCQKNHRGEVKITWIDSLPWLEGAIRPSINLAHIQLQKLLERRITQTIPHKDKILIQTNENRDNRTSCGDCTILNATSYADRIAPPKITMENLRKEHNAQLDELGLNFTEIQRVNTTDPDIEFTIKTLELEPKLAFANQVRILNSEQKDALADFLKCYTGEKDLSPEIHRNFRGLVPKDIILTLTDRNNPKYLDIPKPEIWEIIEKVDPQFPRSPQTIAKQIASDEALAIKLQQEEVDNQNHEMVSKLQKSSLAQDTIKKFTRISPDPTPSTKKLTADELHR